jgi:hypothetical protein
MDELHSLRHALRPLWMPSLVLVGLLVASGINLSSAGRVTIPPAPDALIVERVRIDQVEHTREPAGPSGPSLKTAVAVRLAQSEDWPGVSFRFSGDAAGVSIIPPVVFDLHLVSNLAQQTERRRQWPNLFPQLEVYGVAQDGHLLVDPQTAHDRLADRKRRSTLFGYGFMALALLPGFLLVRRGRTVWSRLVD